MTDLDILDDIDKFEKKVRRGRDLLPLWIKVFMWMFFAFGGFVFLFFLIGIAGNQKIDISIYGFQAYRSFSITGVIVLFTYALKFLLSYSMWKEKSWMIEIAYLDAVLAFILCVLGMAGISNFDGDLQLNNNLRLELLIYFPFVYRIFRIKADWRRLTTT